MRRKPRVTSTVASLDARRSIQSAEVVLAVLAKMGELPGPASLKTISHALDMPSSKVHRYLASLLNTGFVRQNPDTRDYELGAAALRVGLGALAQLDILRLATHESALLAQATGLTSLIAVPGETGATIVRMHRGVRHVVTSIGVGSVLPLTRSATGRALLAFTPEHYARGQTEREVPRAERSAQWRRSLDALLAQTRATRLAVADGTYIPGLRAVSAPVLNSGGDAVLAITLMCTTDEELEPRSKPTVMLQETCLRLSRDTGAPGN
jgi:DNA-binding IclR family transcriptional regulator